MARRLLLVEGSDDVHVVKHLCNAHGIPIDFEFSDVHDGGVERLLSQIPIRLKESEIENLGIIIDADEDAAGRWAALRGRLLGAGYENIPDAPEPAGTIINLDDGFRTIRFGAWIMPDNRLPGMLEHFLGFLVPQGDRILPYVDSFLASIPAEHRPFREAHLAKARI